MQALANSSTIRRGVSVLAIVTAALVAAPALAQQAVPGSAQCPLVGGVVTCTGDIHNGFKSDNVAGVAAPTASPVFTVGGNLTLDGTLNVTDAGGFGNGVYRLFAYGGSLTDNGLSVGMLPGTFSGTVQTATAGQVNLVVGNSGGIQFWDGTSDGGGGASDGLINGGSGTWSLTEDNWTTAQAQPNDIWRSGFAVFQGARLQGSTFVPNPGTVTIVPAGVSASGLQFAIDGYRIEGGTLTLTAPATIRVGDGTTAGSGMSATIASAIAGSGGIEKTDLGTLILSGANTYTGGTRVLSGVLTVANDGALGAAAGGVTLDGGTLRAGGALTSARGFTLGTSGGTLDLGANGATLSGVLSGSGALTVTGSSLLTLSGNSAARTGATRIASGTLALSGSLGGPLTIASGASLTGTGTTGNLIVEGRVAPGNSPGTLTVNGNLVFAAGSTYAVELGAAGATDRINATGTATLNGGTVAITTLDPDLSYTNGSVYRILNAAGGRTGTFAGLTENSAFLDFALAYDPTGVNVNVAVVRTFPAVAQTFNQTNAATGLRDLGQVAGSDPLIAYQAILLLDSASARAAFDAASGEIYPTMMAATLRRGALASDRLAARAFSGSGTGWGLWGGASGHTGRVESDGNGAQYSYDGIVGELGIDYRGTDNRWAVGVGGGVFSAGVGLPGRASRAEGDGWHVGGYARVGDGHAGLSAVVTGDYARSTADVIRSIAFGNLARTATARPRVTSHTLSFEARYGFGSGDWAFGPVAGMEYAKVRLGRFTESGANSLNLTGGDNRDEATRWIGGLFANFQGTHGTIDLSLRYARGDRLSEAGLTLAGSPTAFRVRSAAGSEDAVQARISGDYSLGGGWSLGGDVRGTLASEERALAGSATLSFRF